MPAGRRLVGCVPTALLFPGQGSHEPGMRDTVAAHRPDLLERVGEEVFELAAESTAAAQPAIFCASLAAFAQLRIQPDAAAGHSLGELAALTAAGVFTDEDGLRLVTLRGRLMEAAPPGGMLAVLGKLDAPRGRFGRPRAWEGVTVANDNAPGQIVLSGTHDALAVAARELEGLGLRTMTLPVAGAFHSPLMAPVVEPFRRALAQVEVHPARFTVFSCSTAAPFTDVRAELTSALTSPVRWRETVAKLAAGGIDEFVECGPGRVLTRLTPRILKEEARA